MGVSHREEFLINRILQRQNAAPAWVELQKGESKYQGYLTTR
jgi:hypothetical protein